HFATSHGSQYKAHDVNAQRSIPRRDALLTQADEGHYTTSQREHFPDRKSVVEGRSKPRDSISPSKADASHYDTTNALSHGSVKHYEAERASSSCLRVADLRLA